MCGLFAFCISCSNNSKQLELIPVKSGEKWGYINKKGEYVINPQFANVDFFREGLAKVVSSDGKIGFINKSGKYAIPPKFKSATTFSDGLAFVVFDGGHPICIDKSGETKFQLKQAKAVTSFSEGFALFSIVDKDGKEKYGFVNKVGNVMINPQFEDALLFSEGLAAVAQNDKWGFIDKSGKFVINPQFDAAGYFCNGLSLIEHGNRYGYINKQGKIEINPQYDEAGVFREGMAVVLSGEEYGYISKDGKFVINPQFDDAGYFYSGLALIEQGEHYGYINKQGKIEINPQFDDASRFYGDIAFVESADKWGVIDKKGKYLVNPQFDLIKTIIGDFSYVFSDFYDANLFISQFFEEAKGDSIDGFSVNSTLQSVVDNDVYGDDLRADSKYTASCNTKQKITDDICIRKTLFHFINPIYKDVTTYSNYYGYQYKTGSTKKYDFSAKIAVIEYQFGLSGDAYDKGESIANALKKEIERRYSVEMEAKDGQYAVYQDKNLSFVITYSDYFLSLYIGFDKGELRECVDE